VARGFKWKVGLPRPDERGRSSTDEANACETDRKSLHESSRKSQLKDSAHETIDLFSKRSDSTVTRITMAFALGGALMDIGARALSVMFMNGAGISMLWGMWIPLCFITIPPIHYLCRHVQILKKRIEVLESQSAERRGA
jgi:hypothetical protein